MSTTAATITMLGARTASERWVVFVSTQLGYILDVFDFALFTIIARPCLIELLGTTDTATITVYSTLLLMCKFACWGAGGIFLGLWTDRVGRRKILMFTILGYAVFTGLSGLSSNFWILLVLQSLSALFVAGEWAGGITLLTESLPNKNIKAYGGIAIQSSFALGYLLAALFGQFAAGYLGWRWMLGVGVLPALLVLLVRSGSVKESPLWENTQKQGRQGSFSELFNPALCRRTIVGFAITASMLVVWWGAQTMLPGYVTKLALASDIPAAEITKQISIVFRNIMFGSLFGYATLLFLARFADRKPVYFVIAIGAMFSSLYMFLETKNLEEVKYCAFILGLFAVAGFGFFGYYLPELFPTHVRGAALGFTYNAGRFVIAIGAFFQALIVGTLGSPAYAGAATAVVALIGAVAIYFGPETRTENVS
jgi:MFS family permease